MLPPIIQRILKICLFLFAMPALLSFVGWYREPKTRQIPKRAGLFPLRVFYLTSLPTKRGKLCVTHTAAHSIESGGTRVPDGVFVTVILILILFKSADSKASALFVMEEK